MLQPLSLLLSPPGAGTHLPLPGSQAFGATQSSIDTHLGLHVPLLSHLYGAQSVFAPLTSTVVWSPSQVAPEMHFFVVGSQMFPVTQSAFVSHVFLHSVAPQAYAPQGTAGGTWQEPFEHVPAAVALPSVQLAVPHVTLGPTNPEHVLRVVPSHVAAVHGFASVPPAHAAREPCGLSVMGVHAPSLFFTSHASH